MYSVVDGIIITETEQYLVISIKLSMEWLENKCSYAPKNRKKRAMTLLRKRIEITAKVTN
jgi:hypothetical protein